MHNAPTGSHPVYGMRFYFHFITKGITVHDAAFKQKSEGRKSNVRMWQDIKIIPFTEFHRSHMVYINKRSYHSFLTKGQQTPNHKLTNVCSSFFYNEIDV